MDDTAKILLAIFVLLAIGIFAVVAMSYGSGGAVSSVGGAASSAPAYLPGSIGRGCGV